MGRIWDSIAGIVTAWLTTPIQYVIWDPLFYGGLLLLFPFLSACFGLMSRYACYITFRQKMFYYLGWFAFSVYMIGGVILGIYAVGLFIITFAFAVPFVFSFWVTGPQLVRHPNAVLDLGNGETIHLGDPISIVIVLFVAFLYFGYLQAILKLFDRTIEGPD